MDVADIHLLEDNEAGWVLFIEGLAVGFTNIVALAGTGASSWIGTGWGARTIKRGLRLPAELSYGESDPWSSEINDSTPAAITLLDHDETLVSLFIDDEPDETTDTLAQRLSPLDDPAPDPGIGLDGEIITLWDRDVGIEHVGPAGQRRHFWICPDDVPPGLDHFAAVGWPASRVGDAPSQWAGRKIAIYRIVRDPGSGAWPSWDDQYAGGSLWWYGTMTDRGEWTDVTDGDEQGRGFTFYALGLSSWTERTANLSRPVEWYTPRASVQLSGDELKVAAWIEPLDPPALGDGIGDAVTVYDVHTLASGDDLTGADSADEFFEIIRDIAYTMADGTDHGSAAAANNSTWGGLVLPAGDEWNDGVDPRDRRRVRISNSGRTIEIKCEPTPEGADTGAGTFPCLGFRLCIAADSRVWQAAGWDINRAEFRSRAQTFGVCRVGGPDWGEAEGAQVLPPYHVTGMFSTRNETEVPPAAEKFWDNDGNWRTYTAPWDAGCVTLSHDGGTEVFVAIGTVRCEGQHGSPFTLGSQIDGSDCDAAGWWLFRGMRLTTDEYLAGKRDGTPYVGVALCEWVSTLDGTEVEVNDEGYATIRIVRWEDPRRFSLPFDPLTEDWVNLVGVLECCPLGVLGGIAVGAPGWRHRLIVTALLSTGTSVWDTSGDLVTITPGANQPGDFIASETAGDIEVADLGLGIPAPFVDWQSFYIAASQLPGGVGGSLNRVLYSLYGSQKISTVLRECMSGAGWSWSLMRRVGGFVPAFGCYDPLRPVQPGNVVATLTRDDIAELGVEDGPQWRGVVELRNGGPYDDFQFEVGRCPVDVDNAEPYTLSMPSTDTGARFRSGKIPWLVKDSGLIDPTHWLGMPGGQVYDWTGNARTRFASGIGPRLAKQQRIYRAVYNARFAGVLGLGSQVHVVDSTAETPTGTRGINHRGRVIELAIVARGTGKCSVKVAVELERKAVDEVRVWGPCAYAEVDSWDADTGLLTVIEDHLLAANDHSDTLGFTRPAWVSHPAALLVVLIFQSEDGETWPDALTVIAEVSTADSGASTIDPSSIDGTLLRDTLKYVVAMAYDEATYGQLAYWPGLIFAPATAASGLYDGVNKGIRLK
jgi:hypothetical protein